MSRIVVFGATGGTGREVVRQGIAAGHDVTAVVRRASREFAGARTVDVDFSDAQALNAAVAGADVVVSALGARNMKDPTSVYSDGVAAILAAMAADDVRRIVVVSAEPVTPSSEVSRLKAWFAYPLLWRFFGGGYADMRRMEALLAHSDTDWTVFRPPRLTESAPRGRYRTATGGLSRALAISRADLAAAMLLAATTDTGRREVVTIAY